MSFSSRRRNYLLVPHRRDGLIEWMKSMLQHSFVLDALEATGADTFSHFEALIEEHRLMEAEGSHQASRLKQIVPTIGTFHTPLPLREAFLIYNEKHRLTKRKHIQVSFNEIRHILNLAQIMALRKVTTTPSAESAAEFLRMAHVSGSDLQDGSDDQQPEDCSQLNGPRLISFDADQTLYNDGSNFEDNPRLANYLYLLLRHGVTIAVVTAAGYEYFVEKYEYRLSGLFQYFQRRGLSEGECERFYLFGGECNYLLQLRADYHLHPVKETGPGGWMTSTLYSNESPGNWTEIDIQSLLDVSEQTATTAVEELNLRGRVIRKKRSVGLIPHPNQEIPRESLDEVVLRVHEKLRKMNDGKGPGLPYCAFNGGTDAWVDVGNKRVGVQVLQAYLNIAPHETLHIGDQFLNTGNDHAARAVCPCIWIINPKETTYILKSILRLSRINVALPENGRSDSDDSLVRQAPNGSGPIDFVEMERRTEAAKKMDVYTGELINS